ncbi:putative inner membrane protein [Chlamydia abortus]|nr:putative inner membrane protein [Chlamydia abortus]
MEEGALSGVEFNPDEGPFFYKCLSHQTCMEPTSVEKLFLTKNHLNEEILGSYIEHFIDEGVR